MNKPDAAAGAAAAAALTIPHQQQSVLLAVQGSAALQPVEAAVEQDIAAALTQAQLLKHQVPGLVSAILALPDMQLCTQSATSHCELGAQ